MLRALASIFSKLNRHFIYILVALAVIIPLLKPLNLPVKPSPNSRTVFQQIEALQPGDTILMSFDYDPASEAELQPMANVVLRHCFERGIKVIACALWIQGPSLATEAFRENRIDTSGKQAYSEKKYGVDFINLGAHPNYLAAVTGMGSSFPTVWKQAMPYYDVVDSGSKGEISGGGIHLIVGDETFNAGKIKAGYKLEIQPSAGDKIMVVVRSVEDKVVTLDKPLPEGPIKSWTAYSSYIEGGHLSQFPITKNIKTYDDVKLIFSLTTGTVGLTTYIQIARTQYGTAVTGGCTAVTALELYPYLQSKQLTGLLEGMKGGSDYEELTNYPKQRIASEAMEAQSVVHILLIVLILIGNFMYFVEKTTGLKG